MAIHQPGGFDAGQALTADDILKLPRHLRTPPSDTGDGAVARWGSQVAAVLCPKPGSVRVELINGHAVRRITPEK